MAICLQVIHWACEHPQETPPLTIYFMDEEEVGLKGSIAYLTQHRVKDLRCLLNLEMLGMGDRFALWPLHESDHSPMISAAQSAAAKLGTSVTAFDRIVTNTADHVSFRNVGVRDCFSLTGISTKELSAAEEYYAAMKRRAGLEELTLIMQKAPVFEHYHRETDTADKLNEQSLARAALLAWLTLTGLKAD
jgi:Zn-dependent M28 family amino/carboxypeptidase